MAIFQLGQMPGITHPGKVQAVQAPRTQQVLPKFGGFAQGMAKAYLGMKERQQQSANNQLAGKMMMGDPQAAADLAQRNPDLYMNVARGKREQQLANAQRMKQMQTQRIRTGAELGLRLKQADPTEYERILRHYSEQAADVDPGMAMQLQKLAQMSQTPDGQGAIDNLSDRWINIGERFGEIGGDQSRTMGDEKAFPALVAGELPGEKQLKWVTRSGDVIHSERYPIELSEGDKKRRDDYFNKSASSKVNIGSIDELLSYLDDPNTEYSAGLWGQLSNQLKGWFGVTDIQSYIRTKYNEIRQRRALNLLPPGAASDKDVSLVLNTQTPDLSNKETMARYLRGIRKAEVYSQLYNEFRGRFTDDNANSSRAYNDYIYDDKYKINRGETAKDAWNRISDFIVMEEKGIDPMEIKQYELIRNAKTGKSDKPISRDEAVRRFISDYGKRMESQLLSGDLSPSEALQNKRELVARMQLMYDALGLDRNIDYGASGG